MQTLAALADPIRREIVEVLLEHPQDAGTIARRFPVSRPAVSRHLRVLRESGIVRSETIAQRRVYHVETAPLEELDDWLTHYRQFWTDRFDKLEEHLERGD
jgi:DNA-binding transcriptional ArsR family regulator